MAKKSELEADHGAYKTCIDIAIEARQQKCLQDALATAKESWRHIDGMLQFEKRYGNGQPFGVDGIEIVLDLAPVLFDFVALDELEELLERQKRIERATGVNFIERLHESRELMYTLREIWNRLEAGDVSEKSLQAFWLQDAGTIPGVLDMWTQIGLVERVEKDGQRHIGLVTKPDGEVVAKCGSCGGFSKAQMRKFLESQICPKCFKESVFVIR